MIVWSEVEAFHLLHMPRETTANSFVFHEAGNRIIALAERIKAERAVAAMEVGK